MIKAINNTTVEVTFDEEVTDVKALDFAIEGLEVSNAAVKQSNKKVVVLTTAAQTADKEYTVSLNDEKIGSFKGVSAVVPTKVTLSENAIQGVVGKQVTLKADIGVKAAGVPVTFNVKSSDRLTEDYVQEVLTDANGIATYSYTQYIAGTSDDVAVYPTGAPATRDVARVHWGVDTILSLVADDKKGNAVNNGENKVYKVIYKDAKTGKPVSDKTINVTFKENIDVAVDKITKATVNGKTPYQLSNGSEPEAVTVKTNSKGEATFTVTGSNTKATPVVFIDEAQSASQPLNGKLDNAELQVSAEQVTFAAEQSSYDMTITRDGGEEAAYGTGNGREYKIAVKTKDGKVAAGEVVNVALNEDIDRDINTNSKAIFVKDADDTSVKIVGSDSKQITVKLDSKGEGTFTIESSTLNDYATPIAWLDINTNNSNFGKLDEGETSKLADKTYFVAAKITSGSLKAYNSADKEVKEDKKFAATETAKFKFVAANQSGKAVANIGLNTSYTVFNTGTNDVKVTYKPTASSAAVTETVSTNKSITVQVNAEDNYITVTPDGDKTASVRVEANATTTNSDKTYLGNLSAKASFLSSADLGETYVGTVESIDKDKEKIKFVGKDTVSYKGAKFVQNGSFIHQSLFEQIATNAGAQFSYNKDKDGNVTFTVFAVGTKDTTEPTATAKYVAKTEKVEEVKASAVIDNDTDALTTDDILTFTSSAVGTAGNDIKIDLVDTVDSNTTTTVAYSVNGSTKVITVDLANDASTKAITATLSDVVTAINSLTTTTTVTATVPDAGKTIIATVKNATTTGGVTPVAEVKDSTLTLTFDEAIETSTLSKAADLTLSGVKTLGTDAKFAWSSDKKVLTITLGTGATVAANDTITATTAKDLAGNALTVPVTIN